MTAETTYRGNDVPSLNSFPPEFSATTVMFSRTTIRPASFKLSRSGAGPLFSLVFAPARNVSLNFGITFSVNALLPDGKAEMILKTFCKTKARSSRSLVSSSNAGRTFFSITDFGNWFKIRGSPLMNWDFSFGVFAGNESKKRMVETRMLSKY